MGEHWTKVSRWLYHGQARGESKGGHSVGGRYWSREEALVLWFTIHTLMGWDLSSSEVAAYKRRQAQLAEMFGLSMVDRLGAIAWTATPDEDEVEPGHD